MHTVDTVAADKGDAWAHYAFESLVEATAQPQELQCVPASRSGVES